MGCLLKTSPRRTQSIHTYIYSYLVHHIQSLYKTVPYTFSIGYKALTSQLQQVLSNRAGQPLTKTQLQLYGSQKKPAKKTLVGKNYDRKPNSKQLAAHRTRLYSSKKINFKTEKKLGISQRLMVGSEGLDGYHVLHSLLYTTASLPMTLRPF